MGATMPKPVTTKVLERRGNKVFRVGAASMNGMRERMEDDHSIELHDDWGFFGVFDGHVGPECSTYMAKRFPECLREMQRPVEDETMVKLSLDLDKEFMKVNPASPDGSTGTYFMATKGGDGSFDLQVGNVGDSRVILCKGGKAVEMTTDHKPCDVGEKNRIEAAGGHVACGRVDGKLAVSRAYGDAEYKIGNDATKCKVTAVPDVTHACVSCADYAVLSCDGVFESHFTSEQVIEFVNSRMRFTNDLAAIASAICDEALERGSNDNISAMIVQFTDGSDYAGFDPHGEIIVGPYSAPDSVVFTSAYKDILKPFKMSVVDALEHRYEYLRKQIEHRVKETKTTLRGCDLETLDESELRRLIVSFHGGGYVALLPYAREELSKEIQNMDGANRVPSDIKEMINELTSYVLEGKSPPPKNDPTRRAWFDSYLKQKEAGKVEIKYGMDYNWRENSRLLGEFLSG